MLAVIGITIAAVFTQFRWPHFEHRKFVRVCAIKNISRQFTPRITRNRKWSGRQNSFHLIISVDPMHTNVSIVAEEDHPRPLPGPLARLSHTPLSGGRSVACFHILASGTHHHCDDVLIRVIGASFSLLRASSFTLTTLRPRAVVRSVCPHHANIAGAHLVREFAVLHPAVPRVSPFKTHLPLLVLTSPRRHSRCFLPVRLNIMGKTAIISIRALTLCFPMPAYRTRHFQRSWVKLSSLRDILGNSVPHLWLFSHNLGIYPATVRIAVPLLGRRARIGRLLGLLVGKSTLGALATFTGPDPRKALPDFHSLVQIGHHEGLIPWPPIRCRQAQLLVSFYFIFQRFNLVFPAVLIERPEKHLRFVALIKFVSLQCIVHKL